MAVLEARPGASATSISWTPLHGGEQLPLRDFATIETLDDHQRGPAKQLVLRVPFLRGASVGNRVKFRGEHFIVVKVTAGARGSELELRCETLADYASGLILRFKVELATAGIASASRLTLIDG